MELQPKLFLCVNKSHVHHLVFITVYCVAACFEPTLVHLQASVLDEENIQRAVDDNFFSLMMLGGLYLPPKWRRNRKISTLWHIFAQFNIVFQCSHQVMCLVYTCYVSYGDMSVFSEAFHFVILVSIMPIVVINASCHRDSLDALLRSYGQGVYDYGDTIDESIQLELATLRKRRKQMKRILILTLFWCYSGGGIVNFGIRPLYEWYIGKWDEIREDGLITASQMTYWYPIKPETWWGSFIFYTSLYIVNLDVTFCIIGNDVGFLALVDELCTEFMILSLTLKQLSKRANLLYIKRYGSEAPIIDVFMKKCYKDCIRKSIEHHQIVLQLAKHVEAYSRWVLLCVTISSTVIICISGVLFTLDNIPYSVKITFLVFLVLEVSHTFIYCWYADMLTRLSSEVGDSVYFGGWENCGGNTLAKDICTMGARSLVPVRLNAGGFAYISLDTFTNIINSSYSFFNLLQLVKD